MRKSAGFTLIEVIVSIGLGVTILLIAVSTFRMAAKALSTLNAVEQETRLIRGAYLQAVEDADFWHSMANPSYPYARRYTSDPGSMFARTNLSISATFAAAPVMAMHPNEVQANDVRAWYPGDLFPAGKFYHYRKRDTNGNGDPLDDVGQHMEFREDRSSLSPTGLSTYRPISSGSFAGSLGLGWTIRAIRGDYSEIASTDPTATRRPVADAIYAQRMAWRPKLLEYLHGSLGMAGVAAYTNPGDLMLYQRPNFNLDLPPASPAAITYVGDMPFQFLQRVPGRFMPGNNPEDRASSSNQPAWTDRTYNARPAAADLTWFCDQVISDGPAGSGTGSPDSLVGALYSSKMIPTNAAGTLWSPKLVVDSTREPFRFISTQISARGDTRVFYTYRQLRDFMTTVHIAPVALADWPQVDISQLREGMPAASYNIMRYRTRRGFRQAVVLRLTNVSTGAVTEIGTTILGTDFRGARQHWGWKTAFDDTSLPAMGDVYQ